MDGLRSEVNQFPVGPTPDVDPTAYAGSLQMTGPASTISMGGGSIIATELSNPSVLQSLDEIEPSAEFEQDAALLQDPAFQLPESTGDVDSEDTISISTSTCAKSLPDPELGSSLLAEFLVDFNTVSPLYRPHAIAEHIRICYEGLSDGTAVSWASTYVVLGIAHRCRAMSNVATPMDNELADYYLSKILPTVSGLLIAPPSLGLVQSLLGLTALIRTSSQLTPHSGFITSALRISQFLAYQNTPGRGSDSSQDDVEQAHRVFWLAFIMDTDEAIFSNAPTTQRREDITAPFPEENPHDSLGSMTAAESNWKVNVFALRARLALIQAEAIDQLLSINRRPSTPQQIASTAQAFLARLEAWRDNNLFRLKPVELMQLLYRSDLLHVLTVEASYFATVFRIHAFLALNQNPLANPFAAEILARLATRTEQRAFKDAERLLALLALTPHGDIGVCW